VKTLAATFVAKMFVDTVGALDPFGGKVYLPSPARFMGTFLLWGLLGMVAAFGPNASRVAGRIAAVTLLAAAVLGPFGAKAIAFLKSAISAIQIEGSIE
jgi:hypothetical protein